MGIVPDETERFDVCLTPPPLEHYLQASLVPARRSRKHARVVERLTSVRPWVQSRAERISLTFTIAPYTFRAQSIISRSTPILSQWMELHTIRSMVIGTNCTFRTAFPRTEISIHSYLSIIQAHKKTRRSSLWGNPFFFPNSNSIFSNGRPQPPSPTSEK